MAVVGRLDGPSARLIVPNLPGRALAAALGVPITGGQNVAQVPLQFDDVGVSIANQYSVRPWELTSTVPLLVLAVLIPVAPTTNRMSCRA